MMDGTNEKTQRGDRQIISVSLPLEVYEKMQELCDHYNLNRSAMIASAIASYLREMGLKVGER